LKKISVPSLVVIVPIGLLLFSWWMPHLQDRKIWRRGRFP
jgi:hypothetical protein